MISIFRNERFFEKIEIVLGVCKEYLLKHQDCSKDSFYNLNKIQISGQNLSCRKIEIHISPRKNNIFHSEFF